VRAMRSKRRDHRGGGRVRTVDESSEPSEGDDAAQNEGVD